jgi:hypothetical protein
LNVPLVYWPRWVRVTLWALLDWKASADALRMLGTACEIGQ